LKFNFEWDSLKANENLQKHKLTFERAAEIFLDPLALSIFDEEHSSQEDRWITIGKDHSDRLLVVVHTFREKDNDNAIIRMISARTATKREGGQYRGEDV
jgi:hypothetical protein